MKTPRLVFSLKKLELNAARLKRTAQEVFRGREVEVFYSAKANYHPRVHATLFSSGVGAEVGRLLELKMIPQEVPVLVNGHFKSDEFLKEAIQRKVKRIFVESLEELKRIEKIASSQQVVARVGIRIQVSLDKKVGATPSEVLRIAHYQSSAIVIDAVHFHLGWKESNDEIAERTFASALAATDILIGCSHPVTTMNLGGSLTEASNAPSQAFKRFSLFASKLPSHIKKIELEPGRYFVGDCGLLYAQVQEVRGEMAIINTCAYAYRLTGATPAVDLLAVGSRKALSGKTLKLSGHWASENDVFLFEQESRLPRAGDVIRFRNLGAYVDSWFDQLCLDYPLEFEFDHPLDQLFKILEENQKGAGSILNRHWDFASDELHSLPTNTRDHLLMLEAIKQWLPLAPEGALESQLRLVFADYSTLRRALKNA